MTTILERLGRCGIRRLGRPGRFRYRHPNGRPVSAADRERIEALRIPPAWRDVAVHPSPSGLVQAIGRDAAGRWQYRYHERQVGRRERAKLARLVRFLSAMPRLREAVRRDLARPGLPRERVMAGAVRILATCFLRPGSEVYASENGSYGITTLRPRHVRVKGGVITFDFIGKSGRRHVREVRDPRVARLVRELLRHPGEVFKFEEAAADGGTPRLRDVKSHHVNAYLRERMGGSFTAKDFRTWAGTILAASRLAHTAEEARRSPAARRRAVAAVMREVAESLGNTPAVCRASYVLPVVLRQFDAGRVVGHPLQGLDDLPAVERCERELIALLMPAVRKIAAVTRNAA